MTIFRKIISLKALIFISIVLFIATNSLQPATALTPAQRKVIDSGIDHFNVEETPRSCDGASLTGSDNAEKIWNFFIDRDLKPPQVAGIMGNFKAESGLNPRRVQNTETPAGDSDQPPAGDIGYGLAQWTFADRKEPLITLAQSAGVVPGDLGIQLKYVIQEFEGKYQDMYKDLKGTLDVEKVSDMILVRYEGPKDQGEEVKKLRRDFAHDFLAQFGSGISTPSNPTTCGSSGEVVGDYSLPVARKWYDQHKEWFTKPHHDYPAADIPVPTGTPVYSMTAGKIVSAPTGGDCGQGVIIDAGNGVLFGYCHGSDGGSITGAKEGDQVRAGQKIMHSANTGHSTGPHLHLQIKINDQLYCPQFLFVGIVGGNPPAITSLPRSGCTN